MIKKLFYALGLIVLLVSSCTSDDDNAKTTVKTFDVALSTDNTIPYAMGRTETGNISMTLYDDNTLNLTITVNNLVAGDQLTAAHVHLGDVVSSGGVAITLVNGIDVAFSGSTATGTITITDMEKATLLGDDIYVNVHSMQSAPGLVRGQIDQTIDEAFNIPLSTANTVPAVMGRNETGNAIFRQVGNTLYYKVSVNDLEASDMITAGHIHEGATGVSGGVIVNLDLTGTDQLDITKSVSLNADQMTKLTTASLYVNIHSSEVASGLVRGQIR